MPTAARNTSERINLRACLVADDRTGHRRQLESLALALARHCGLTCQWVHPVAPLKRWFSTSLPVDEADLVIGCGRRTQRTTLWLARRVGAMSIALMDPRMLRERFDLCAIPRHDGIPPSEKVLVTEGTLSPMRAGKFRDSGAGLFLIGGVAKDFEWSDAKVWRQVESIVARHPIQWTLTTSRRTPASFLHGAPDTVAAKVRVVDGNDCDAQWLVDHLAECGVAWVTEDSASMVYDALSAGAATGLISVERRRKGRLAGGVDRLADDGLITRYQQWRAGARLSPPPKPLKEADRVARVILNRLTSP